VERMSDVSRQSESMLARLRKSWRAIAIGFGAAAIVAAVITFLLPRQWQARAAIIMPIEDQAVSSFAILGGQATPVEYYLGILDSYPARRSLAETAKIELKDLEEKYDLQSSPVESQVRIAVKDENKKLALEMVQAALDHLRSTVNTTVASMASREAEFLQQALSERERDLAIAEERLVEFTRSAKTSLSPENPLSGVSVVARQRELGIALERKEEQIKAAKNQAQRRAEPSAEIPLGIPSIEEWRKRVETLEYDLNLKRISLGDQAPEVVGLKESLTITRKSLQEAVQNYLKANRLNLSDDLARLESERQVLAWELETLGKIAESAPTEATQYSMLLRNVRSITESISSLRAQFEAARVKAEVERARWSVLVEPYIEDEPMPRGTTRNAALGGVLGAGLAALWALARRPKAGA